MTRIKQGVITLLSAVAANGAGVAIDVSDYKSIVLQVVSTGTTTATIKFAASMKTKKPDFTASPSSTNVYDYVQIIPLNAQTALAGSTGIAITGTDIIKLYEIQTDYIKWLCPIVSSYSAGAVTVECDAVADFTR